MTCFEINAQITTPSFQVGLPRTVCESVRLNVENMAPFVNIFDICFGLAHAIACYTRITKIFTLSSSLF